MPDEPTRQQRDPRAPPWRLAEGQVFAGRYRAVRLLGRGGMGIVHEVEDLVLGERVALKILTAPGDRGAVERFRREVRVARRVTHPNVARIHDIGEHEEMHFLTMQLVDGGDLSSLLAARRALPWPRAVSLLLSVARALGAAHAASVVHRDLKPSNVLVDRSGLVVLSDFGLARAIHEDVLASVAGAAMVGTLVYMAPEQVIGEPVDARADVYALGLLAYELLTGVPPFEEKTPMATAISRLHRPPPDPRSLAPTIPDELALLVLRCLARHRAARPADGNVVAHALASLAGDEHGAQEELVRSAEAALRARSVSLGSAGSGPRSTRSRDHTLLVSPLRYHGPAEHAALAATLGDQMSDLLARAPGLRIVSASVTERSASAVHVTLAADARVEGAVHVAGDRLRVSVRLLDGQLGAQLWSERFESELGDVFELEDRVGRRVVEALRVGLTTALHRGDAPVAAIQPYLRARRALMSTRFARLDEVVSQLERCLEQAPGFAPAIAAHASACLRAWFIPGASGARDWEASARESVARALEVAADLPESHLASAVLAAQDGDFRACRVALEDALEIAPTYAEALDYLGRVCLEAGRADAGLGHLRAAMDLEPTLDRGLADVMRHHELRGRRAEADALLARIEAGDEGLVYALRSRARLAAYRRDRDTLRALASRLVDPSDPELLLIGTYVRGCLGEVSIAGARATLEGMASATANRRFHAFLQQLLAEIAGSQGEGRDVLDAIAQAARGALVDVEWIERCPLLDEVRGEPAFEAARALVRERAAAAFR